MYCSIFIFFCKLLINNAETSTNKKNVLTRFGKHVLLSCKVPYLLAI